MATSNIQVVFELGHTAFRKPDASEGSLTHDWIVFLRGPKENPNAVEHFIRKVVFHLHGSFTNPIRMCDKPPYQVIESGYGGFTLPIDVYFKGRDENLPYRIRFDYDLTLFPQDSINCLQIEKISFRNPAPDFRKKLLEGGGSGVMDSDVQAVLPERRLMQSFEHLPGARVFGGPLLSPPSFEEFAKLFGLTLAPTQSSTKRSSAEPSINRSRKASSGSNASSTTGERPKSATSDLSSKKGLNPISEFHPVAKKTDKTAKKEEKSKPDEKPLKRTSQLATLSVPPSGKEKKTQDDAAPGIVNVEKPKKSTKSDRKGSSEGPTTSTSELEPHQSALKPTSSVGDLSSTTSRKNRTKHIPSSTVDQSAKKTKSKSQSTPKETEETDGSLNAQTVNLPSSVETVVTDSTGNWSSPANSAFMSPRTGKNASGLPVTPSWSDELKASMGTVPKMLSPLPSPPSSPERNWDSSGSSTDVEHDVSIGSRRASTGFKPSRPQDRDLPLVDVNGFVSALSDPSDTEESPAKSRTSLRRSLTKSVTSLDETLDSDLENMKDVRIFDHLPISPLVDDKEDDGTPAASTRTPPRHLTADEEYERYKLQVVLSQLDGRGLVQSIVDVLDPLGAFDIDERAGTFSFNLYMLDDAVIEKIKTLARFEDYEFEEEAS